jgi:hypothetical protein
MVFSVLKCAEAGEWADIRLSMVFIVVTPDDVMLMRPEAT